MSFLQRFKRLPILQCISIITSLQASYAMADEVNLKAITLCQFDTELDAWRCPEGRVSESTAHLDLDWIDTEFLSDERRARLGPSCNGAYVDPLKGTLVDDSTMSTLPLIIEADSTQVTDSNIATLNGDVRVSQGARSIAAESMSYDRLNDTAELDGNVTIRQPDILIRGSSAQVSTIDQYGKFSDARFVMHSMHMRGSATSIEQKGPNQVVLRDGAITSCEPNSQAWSLEGEELGVNNEDGQGYGKNVTLKLGSVPVFYLPYISFPIGDERRSGLLFPSISSSDDGGLDVAVPYYLNLAPNYDMTLTPRLITGRGAMLETEFRHLNKAFNTQFSAAYLSDDDGGNKVSELDGSTTENDEELHRHQGSNRWLVQLQQSGGQRSGWYSNIDYTKTSDEDYFRDLGTSSFSVSNTTYLDHSLEVGSLSDNWNVNARIQDYQTLLLNLDAPYRKVPQISADGIYNFNGVKFSLENQITRFDHRDSERLNGSPIVTGERIFLDYRIGQKFSNAGAYIKPQVGYKVLHYQFHLDDESLLLNDEANLAAGQFSLDIGAVFEHNEGEYLQTLEPRIFYLFREYEDHSELYDVTGSGVPVNFDTSVRTFSYSQLYHDSRFSGSDRLDDANQATFGLTNRWSSQKDGHEFLSLSFGQINHFRDRRIGLESEIEDNENASEWALEFGFNWRNGSGLYGNLVYDDAAEQMNRFSTGYNFASQDQLSLFSFAYSYVRENPEVSDSERLNQLDTAFIAPIKPQWYAVGRSNYDFENEQELETFFGIEYNDCCYRIRLLARRWLDSNIANLTDDNDAAFDQGIFFEVHLKGLGGSGAKVNSILEDAIPGYSRREQALERH